MKKGTVVLCQIEITPENGESVVLLGTFGIITDTFGIGGYMVHFADHIEPMALSDNYITPLGNDNWNDHLLRQQYEIRVLRNALEPFAKAHEHVTKLDDDDNVVDVSVQETYKVGVITAGDLKRAHIALGYGVDKRE